MFEFHAIGWNVRLIILLAAGLFPLASAPACAQSTDQNSGLTELGIWRTTSAQTTVILAIRPDGTGLFVWINGGANSVQKFTWKEAPGGILVDSVPRFRFWKGRHPDEARVEMEPLPAELTSRGVREFPLRFFMKRDEGGRPRRPAPPLPEGWDQASLPDDWDASAGRRRLAAER